MPDQPAQQSRFPANRIFNLAGALMGTLLIVIGIALCADAANAGIEAAREFILGLYMCGFGAFAVATECVYMPNVVKYMLILDSYLGKGCFFIFWGFLMWGKKPEWSASGVLLLIQHVAAMAIIASLIFLGAGVCFICGSFAVSSPPVYLCGERPADAKPGAPPRAPEAARPAPPGDPVWPPA